MYIVIVGGGEVGYSLARALIGRRHEVVIVEEEPERCNGLVKELNIVVINGNGTDLRTLSDAQVEKSDVVIALTGRDQDNLIICQLSSHHFKVPRTIARVSNPRNKQVFEQLGGVTNALNTTEIISTLIEEEVSLENLMTLLAFKGGEIVLVQVELKEDSPAHAKRIVDLNLPEECVIVLVIRGEDILFPRGYTTLKAGDKILALTSNKQKKILQNKLVKGE